MGISLYKIAEEAREILEKRVPIQVLIESAKNAYGFVAKKQWFENTTFDEQMVDGSIITTFKGLEPKKDLTTGIYYIDLPSSYITLPHQAGITWVSNAKDSTPFVKVNNWGLFSGIKASFMGGRQVYQVEGNKIYFPKMDKQTNYCTILLKLAIAYDAVDPYEQLNIGANMVQEMLQIIVAPYIQKVNPEQKIREILN